MNDQTTSLKAKKQHLALISEIFHITMLLPESDPLAKITQHIESFDTLVDYITHLEKQYPGYRSTELLEVKRTLAAFDSAQPKPMQALAKKAPTHASKVTKTIPRNNMRTKTVLVTGASLTAAGSAYAIGINIPAIKSAAAILIGKAAIGLIATYAFPVTIGILFLTCIAATLSSLLERRKLFKKEIQMTDISPPLNKA
jgi:hypothetical protein